MKSGSWRKYSVVVLRKSQMIERQIWQICPGEIPHYFLRCWELRRKPKWAKFFWGSNSEIQGKLFYFSGIDVNGRKRVWVIWSLRPCRYLSTVTRSSNQGSVDGFRRGKVAESGEFWFALRAKVSWNKITNGKPNYRLLPGANLRPFSFGESVGPLRWSPQHW